jgi:HEAT repeat protein
MKGQSPQLLKLGAFFEGLQTPDPAQCSHRTALLYIGKPAQAAAPMLLPLVNDPNIDVRLMAIEALGRMGDTGTITTQHLTQALQDSDAMIRSRAAEALGIMGRSGEGAIPQLVPLLHDPDLSVRGDVAQALKSLGYQPLRR